MPTRKKRASKKKVKATESAKKAISNAASAGAGIEGDDILDIKEAVKLLRTTQPTFYRWLREGRINGMKVGRQWRFNREDIERFMRGEAPRVELPADISPLLKVLERRLRDSGAKAALREGATPIEVAYDLMARLGLALNASDIHLEVFQDSGVLRYRVDGVLHEVARFNPRLMPVLVDQWKRMAKCNVQEKALPQDGRIILPVGQQEIDVRVHILPTVFGETVIARLITAVEGFSMESLPFRPEHREVMIRHLHALHGVIICCGPTGSGKTTTMYAALNHLNVPGRKLVSVEDPVEYCFQGVSQIQTREAQGLTFAVAVRSSLRSDPDVIMVGEIRDSETAHLCHAAALTGHLVLTQLHANDAALALTRLTDMGVPPFLVGDALRLVIAQRLVRKVCTNCATRVKPATDDIERAMRRTANGGAEWERLPKKWVRAVGCKECRWLGYRGRTCVNELLEMTSEIRAALMRGASSTELRRIAFSQGMTTLAAEAILRAANGETTLQEALGVIPGE